MTTWTFPPGLLVTIIKAEEFHLHNYDVPEKFGEFLDIFSAFKAKWKRELEKNSQ